LPDFGGVSFGNIRMKPKQELKDRAKRIIIEKLEITIGDKK
jgi:hypothetical protein